MVTKEEFNKVWKDSTKEDILNQFYYEHIAIRKAIDKLAIKQARFINEKDYILDDNDLDEIMYILQNGSEEKY